MKTKNLVYVGKTTIFKTLAIGLVAGAILTANGGVKADDAIRTETHSSSEVVLPSDTPTVPSDTPTVPAETPTVPAETPTVPAETPTVPSDTPTITDKGEPAIQPELSEAVVSDKGEPAIQPELSEAVVTNKGTPEVQPELPKAEKPKAELPKTTVEANEQGKSQIGTTSTSTGQVVHDVTKEPVETNTGASIVSTQGGNVVLSDGSVVAPEEVGGTVNEDKTISVTDKEGKLKTLPNTGTAKSILTTIGGMLMTAVGYFYKKKLF